MEQNPDDAGRSSDTRQSSPTAAPSKPASPLSSMQPNDNETSGAPVLERTDSAASMDPTSTNTVEQGTTGKTPPEPAEAVVLGTDQFAVLRMEVFRAVGEMPHDDLMFLKRTIDGTLEKRRLFAEKMIRGVKRATDEYRAKEAWEEWCHVVSAEEGGEDSFEVVERQETD